MRARAKLIAAALVTGLVVTGVALARAPSASLDNKFGSHGVAALGGLQLYAVAAQPDGKVVVAGDKFSTSGLRLAVARLTTSGRLDHTFNHGRVLLGPAVSSGGSSGYGVAIQPDGKIVVAGVATGAGSVRIGHQGMLVERFTASGRLDRKFGSHGVTTVLPGSAGGAANAVALLRDGKIVIAGQAKGSDGLPRVALARLNGSGRLDSSFGSGGVSIAQGGQDLGRNGEALGVALQGGSTIVVTGDSRPDFQHEQGIVARFSSRGRLLGRFIVQPNVLGGGTAELRGVAVGRSGQIVAAGAATTSGTGFTPPVEGLALGLSSGLGRRFLVTLTSDGLASATTVSGTAGNQYPGANAVAFGRGGVAVLAGSYAAFTTDVALWSLNGGGGVIGSGTTRTALSKTLSGAANGIAIDKGGRIVLAGTSGLLGSPPSGFVLRYRGFAK